mmetsp:Transcript_26550/g.54704  ORF Transcript_26550/g.54704 Transcript_26550/m.54704 type:complete len:300 (-) Transcript_26550:175-1074(-)
MVCLHAHVRIIQALARFRIADVCFLSTVRVPRYLMEIKKAKSALSKAGLATAYQRWYSVACKGDAAEWQFPTPMALYPQIPKRTHGTDVRVCVRGRALHASNGTARSLCPFSPQPPGPWSTLLDHNYHTMRLELGADCHRLHSALPSRTTLRLCPPIRFLIVHESRVVLLLLSDQQGRRLELFACCLHNFGNLLRSRPGRHFIQNILHLTLHPPRLVSSVLQRHDVFSVVETLGQKGVVFGGVAEEDVPRHVRVHQAVPRLPGLQHRRHRMQDLAPLHENSVARSCVLHRLDQLLWNTL